MSAPESRNEAILQATLAGTEYTAPPQSRIESLLLQLKAAIEDGGGGGGDTQLAARVNAIEAQLFSTIADVPTNTDSGSMDLYSKDLNTITTSGFYNAMTCTNAPATYCTLVVIGYYLSGYCTQIAADVTTGTLYTRNQTNGTWGTWSAKTNAADLAAVATSGAYSDLTGAPNLAAVATSGAYGDLNGKPTIDTAISSTSTNAVQNKAISAALATKAAAADLTVETAERETADAKQAAALVYLIDSGAKNMMPTKDGTNPSGQTWFRQDITLTPGDYVVFFGKYTTTDTDDTECRIAFFDSAGNAAASYQYVNVGSEHSVTNTHVNVTLTTTCTNARFYPAKTVSTSTGDTLTFEDCMICSKAAWDISQEFVPYCPTIPELYAMILAQTAGTRSAALALESENAWEDEK